MEYHIRYSCSGDLQAQIVDFITRNAKKYIIAREFANREHIQCYVETNITKKTWVNKFNIKFTSMDRRDKYVEPDKGKTKQYVCKDGDIIAKRGFTDEEIENFKTEYRKENPKPEISLKNQEIHDAPPLENSKKVKKSKVPTFMMQCRNKLLDEYPDKEWSMRDKPLVFRNVMYLLGQGCKNLDHIIISRMTYGVLNSLIKDKKEWLEYWYRKAFMEELNCDENENYSLDE